MVRVPPPTPLMVSAPVPRVNDNKPLVFKVLELLVLVIRPLPLVLSVMPPLAVTTPPAVILLPESTLTESEPAPLLIVFS